MNKKKEDIIQYYKFCDKSYQHWSQTRKNKTYEIHYGFFDSNHKKHKESLINMNRVMANKLNLKSGWKILDAGCGVGASSIFMAKNYDVDVVGITLSKLQLKKAKEFAKKHGTEKHTDFKIQDFEKTDFPPDIFDGIFTLESACYANSKKKYIDETYRVLKHDRYFVCADFFATKKKLNEIEQYAMNNWLNGWIIPNIATTDHFKKLLKKTGFKNIQITDITKNIYPSAKNIYRRGKEGYPEDIYRKLTPMQMEHVKANIFQYITLKMGLWKYLIFYAKK